MLDQVIHPVHEILDLGASDPRVGGFREHAAIARHATRVNGDGDVSVLFRHVQGEKVAGLVVGAVGDHFANAERAAVHIDQQRPFFVLVPPVGSEHLAVDVVAVAVFVGDELRHDAGVNARDGRVRIGQRGLGGLRRVDGDQFAQLAKGGKIRKRVVALGRDGCFLIIPQFRRKAHEGAVVGRNLVQALAAGVVLSRENKHPLVVLREREGIDLEVTVRQGRKPLVERVENLEVAEAGDFGEENNAPTVGQVLRLDHLGRVGAAGVHEAVNLAGLFRFGLSFVLLVSGIFWILRFIRLIGPIRPIFFFLSFFLGVLFVFPVFLPGFLGVPFFFFLFALPGFLFLGAGQRFVERDLLGFLVPA